jgi:hypothetical protein
MDQYRQKREKRSDTCQCHRRETCQQQRDSRCEPHQSVVDRMKPDRRQPVEVTRAVVDRIETPQPATMESPMRPVSDKLPAMSSPMACAQSGRLAAGPQPVHDEIAIDSASQ